jgi:hypothetical protein
MSKLTIDILKKKIDTIDLGFKIILT